MSGIDLKRIEENYASMSDEKIEQIASKDAYGLRPEVYKIIEKEIKKRNLNPDLLIAAKAQNQEFSLEEIERYSNILRDLPCPICGSTKQKLNGTLAHKVKSMIILTYTTAEAVIACPSCLDKTNNNAIFSSLLLGLWGIPEGIFKTPMAIYKNLKAQKYNDMAESNPAMLAFTASHIGEIEAFKNDTKKLAHIIRDMKI